MCIRDSRAIPLSADSSQMLSIAEAAKGKSVVLHGPPGTGKSQTITNLMMLELMRDELCSLTLEQSTRLAVGGVYECVTV